MSHRIRQALACTTATAVLAGGALASTAIAGPVEQISRGNDATGWAPFNSIQEAVAASDSGRYAIYNQRLQTGPTSGTVRFYLRDIVLNRSFQIGGPDLVKIFGVDKAESKVLGIEYTPAGQKLVLIPLVGPQKTLATFPADTIIYAALSGDGKTVVYSKSSSDATYGLFKINATTGASTKLSDTYSLVGPRSISDNGRVVTGEGSPGGFLYVDGARTELPSTGIVSPDGSVVVYGPSYEDPVKKLSARKVATGAVTTFDYPAGYDGGTPVWIAPDGSKLAVQLGDETLKQIDFATGAWSAYGGAFATSIKPQITEWGNTQNPISRNGKYAALQLGPFPNFVPFQSALVNLSGGDLPGSQEALSASSYVAVTAPRRTCDAPEAGELRLDLAQPASWVAKPRRATVTVTFNGGAGTVTKTFTSASAWNEFGAGQTIPVPLSVTKYTVRAAVIDGAGAYTHTSETKQIFCSNF